MPAASSTSDSLDELDKRIIEQLQEDGRRTYKAIGHAVGLSEAAVRHRVRSLAEAGTIQIVAVTDPLRLGFRQMAMIGVRVDGDLMTAAEHLSRIPEVDYVVITTGTFDLLVEVVCEDHHRLFDLLNDKLRKAPGVAEVQTFTYLRVVKETYSYGTR